MPEPRVWLPAAALPAPIAALTLLLLGCSGVAAKDPLPLGRPATVAAGPAVPLPVSAELATGEHALRVSVASDHACTALQSGRVACWGKNQVGELGYAGGNVTSTPHLVAGVSDAVDVLTLNGLSCARRSAGPILCWGEGQGPRPLRGTEQASAWARDGYGLCVSLASGGASCFRGPELATPAITGLAGFIASTEEAYGFTCAVLALGKVACRGGGVENLGLVLQQGIAVVAGIEDAIGIVTIDQSTVCAFRRGGSVSCFGPGKDRAPKLPEHTEQAFAGGRLTDCARHGEAVSCRGDGLEYETKTFAGKVVDLSCNGTACCAVLREGTIQCFGENSVGLLGDGVPPASAEPTRIEGIDKVARVAVGSRYSLAQTTDGRVLAWGLVGEKGTPAPVATTGHRVVDVDAGGLGGLLTLDNDDLLVVEPTERGFEIRPLPRPGGEILDATMDDAGDVFAAMKSGITRCLIHGGEGEGYLDRWLDLRGFDGVVSLSALGATTSGRTATGEVRWFHDPRAEGDAAAPSGAPRLDGHAASELGVTSGIGLPYAWRANGDVVELKLDETHHLHVEARPELAGVTGISSGSHDWSATCGIRSGRVVCWGVSDAEGQLGLGQPKATRDRGPSTIHATFVATAVAAGNDHGCALDRDGRIWCWGSDAVGQLGRGRTIRTPRPVKVVGIGPG